VSAVIIIMSKDNSELKAYMKNEWKNDRSWLVKGPDCCPEDDGVLAAIRAKFREKVQDWTKPMLHSLLP
jgi:hypothetical protein